MSKEQYVTSKMAEKGIAGKPLGMSQPGRTGLDGTEHKFNAFKLVDRDTYGARGGDRGDRHHPSSASNEPNDPHAMKVDSVGAKGKGGKEVILEFMGSKIKVYEREGQGWIKDGDVPDTKGATMRFEVKGLGVGGEVSFDEIKVRFLFRCL